MRIFESLSCRVPACIARALPAVLVGVALSSALRAQCTITVPAGAANIQAYVSSASTGDVICLSGSAYPPQLVVFPSGLDVTFAGVYPLTVLDGGGSGPVISILGTHTNAMVVRDMVIQNGTAFQGGGIHVGAGARPTVRNVWIRDCSATFGGGLYLNTDPGTPPSAMPMKLSRCIFENDFASADGGGAFIEGVSAFSSMSADINLLLCEFALNFAAGRGGGLALTGGSFVFVDHSWFKHDRADDSGGAIAVFYPDDEAAFPRLSVDQSYFESSSAALNGGAIFVNGALGAWIHDSTFDQNRCDVGASVGGQLMETDNASFALGPYVTQNCLFVGGYADSGGAIGVDEAAYEVRLCTFDLNTSSFGGALYSSLLGVSGSVRDSILWQNFATVLGPLGTQELYVIGSMPTLQACDIAGAVFPGNLSSPPLYVNGYAGSWSPVAGYFLDPLAPSPCIDAGSQNLPVPGLGANWSTNPATTPPVPDAGIVDLGFHYPPP